MALTLTSGITADADEFVVTGAVPANVGPDFRFRIDDELLRLQGFGAHTEIVGAYARQWAGKDPQRWLVERGVEHSTPASHAQGADVLAANDVFASSDDLTPPNPFSGGGGGGGTPDAHAASHENGGSDEINVTGLTGAGGAGAILTATVDLDAADIATLNSEVVAAPGAGKVIVPVRASLAYTPGATAFDNTADVDLECGGWSMGLRIAGTVAFDTEDTPRLQIFTSNFDGSHPPLADVTNQPLMLVADPAPDGAGDGTGRITVAYYVMDLP